MYSVELYFTYIFMHILMWIVPVLYHILLLLSFDNDKTKPLYNNGIELDVDYFTLFLN